MKQWTLYQHIFPNGKSYVGITSKENPYDRFGKEGKEYSHYIGRAIKKYGWDNIEHKILKRGLTQEEANKLEKEYIKKLNTQYPNGYNITKGGEGRAGYHKPHTQETKIKISKTKTGIKLGPHTDIWKKHISEGKLKSNHKHSEETKNKISKNRKGILHTQESKDKISKTCKNKQLYKYMFTEEAVKKYRENRCVQVELLDENNCVVKTFKTLSECADYFNCSIALISLILKGKKYNKYNIRRKQNGTIQDNFN